MIIIIYCGEIMTAICGQILGNFQIIMCACVSVGQKCPCMSIVAIYPEVRYDF